MSRSDPYPWEWVPTEGCKSICMEGGVTHSGLAVVSSFWELIDEPLTRLAIYKLEYVRVSTDVQALIISYPIPS